MSVLCAIVVLCLLAVCVDGSVYNAPLIDGGSDGSHGRILLAGTPNVSSHVYTLAPMVAFTTNPDRWRK